MFEISHGNPGLISRIEEERTGEREEGKEGGRRRGKELVLTCLCFSVK